MCKFEEKFLLCSYSRNLQKQDIDWILKRPIPDKSNLNTWRLNNPLKFPRTITMGQINIPNELKTMSPDESNEHYLKMMKEMEAEIKEEKDLDVLREQKKAELKNIGINIVLNLNNQKCFDKDIAFLNNDILSIRINKTLNMWINFSYQNAFWKVLNIKIAKTDFQEIHKGYIND